MGFFGAMGKALKAPLKPINKAVGAIPGMNKMAPPGASRMGIGPTLNPSGGGMGKLAMMGQMNRPPQAMPQLPPMQMEQQQAPPPNFQPQPFMPQEEPQVPIGEPLPQVGGGGGMMPIPQMQPQKQSMFAQKKPQLMGKAARRGY